MLYDLSTYQTKLTNLVAFQNLDQKTGAEHPVIKDLEELDADKNIPGLDSLLNYLTTLITSDGRLESKDALEAIEKKDQGFDFDTQGQLDILSFIYKRDLQRRMPTKEELQRNDETILDYVPLTGSGIKRTNLNPEALDLLESLVDLGIANLDAELEGQNPLTLFINTVLYLDSHKSMTDEAKEQSLRIIEKTTNRTNLNSIHKILDDPYYSGNGMAPIHALSSCRRSAQEFAIQILNKLSVHEDLNLDLKKQDFSFHFETSEYTGSTEAEAPIAQALGYCTESASPKIKLARALLEKGAKIEGAVPILFNLFALDEDKQEDVVQFIVGKMGSQYLSDEQGRTPVQAALDEGIDADSNLIDLLAIVSNPEEEIVKDIIDLYDEDRETALAKLSPDDVWLKKANKTLLDKAIEKTDLEFARKLLSLKPDEKEINDGNYLIKAMPLGNLEMLELLIENGADVDRLPRPSLSATLYDLSPAMQAIGMDEGELRSKILEESLFSLDELEQLKSVANDLFRAPVQVSVSASDKSINYIDRLKNHFELYGQHKSNDSIDRSTLRAAFNAVLLHPNLTAPYLFFKTFSDEFIGVSEKNRSNDLIKLGLNRAEELYKKEKDDETKLDFLTRKIALQSMAPEANDEIKYGSIADNLDEAIGRAVKLENFDLVTKLQAHRAKLEGDT